MKKCVNGLGFQIEGAKMRRAKKKNPSCEGFWVTQRLWHWE
ncbi:hypothetical protein N483_07450 [Pseudoalteromonas luteoviolacea NCIMB 1944]|nr:hypothetical protein N483_07450 [Pseudoalteromonas luteoviolacea NCIMB 1944]